MILWRGRCNSRGWLHEIELLFWLYLDAEVLILSPPVLSSGPYFCWLPIFVDIQLFCQVPAPFCCRVSLSQSTGILGVPLPALLSNI